SMKTISWNINHAAGSWMILKLCSCGLVNVLIECSKSLGSLSGLFLSVLKMAIAIFYFHNMQKITNENINQFINQELGNWSANVQRLLIEQIRKSKLVLSADLINSLTYQVQDATAESI